MPKKKMRRGSPRAYQVVKQAGPLKQKWARANNPWFDPTFTGVKITTPYDNMPKPLDTSFWDKVAPKLQQTQAPSEYDLALETVRNMKTHQIHYGNTSPADMVNASSGTNILKEGGSLFLSTIDKLERPAYGVANVVLHNLRDQKKDLKNGFDIHDVGSFIKDMAETTTPLGLATKDFWRGFTKKDKNPVEKIVKETGVENKYAKAALTFGVGMGLDPLTYIPGGALVNVLKGGTRAAKTAKAAEAAAKLAKDTSGDRKFIELSDEAHNALWPGAKKAKMPTPVEHGSQESLFPEEFPVYHGPERAPAQPIPKWAREFNKGQQSMVSLKGEPKLFGAEATAKATAAATVARAARKHLETVADAIPAYPGSVPSTTGAARVLKPGQTLFERVEGGFKGSGKDYTVAMERLMGKSMKAATAEEKKVASRKLLEKVSTLGGAKVTEKALKTWRATLKKHGLDDEMIKTLEEDFAGKAMTKEEVKNAVRARVAARNTLAAGDIAKAAAESRPAAEIAQDAANGDIYAQLALDNAGRPEVSMAGAANTTGGGNIGIRKIEELTQVERDIAHTAMDKHVGEMGPKAQADLVKHIREEANRIIRETPKGTKAPKEAWNIRRSATNAQAIARAAMERLSREGIHPKHPDGTAWNILDIADMIGGRQGFNKLFGESNKTGDVGYLHTLSKYATLTAKYLDGEGALPSAVRGKPQFINAVRRMKNAGEAATSVREAKIIQPVLQDISRVARTVAGKGGSDADVSAAVVKSMSAGEKVLKSQGVSDAGVKTYRAAAAAMRFPETPEGKVFLNTAKTTADATIHGDEAASGARHMMNDLTAEANGGRTPKEILDESLHDIESRGVEQGILTRAAALFNPRIGVKQVHAAMLKNISYRQSELNGFRSVLNHIEQNYSKQQIKEAQTLLRSGQKIPTDNELALAIKEMYDNTTRAAGYGEQIAEGQSLAMRGGLTMKELNRELGRQGSRMRLGRQGVDHLGRKVDLSEGSHWLSSAQLWESDDLISDLSHLRAATEQAAVARSFMHDVGQLFGSTVKTAEHTHQLYGPGTESVAGHYFPKEIADQMSDALHKLEELRSPHSDGRKLFENAMGAYKTVFTVMNPRHHVVNNIGNVFLNWMGGVNNPNRYYKAADISKYANSVSKDLASISENFGPGAYAKSMSRDVNAHKIILESRKVAGKSTKMNVQQVYLAAKEYGIVIGAHGAEDIAQEGAMGSKTWLSNIPILNKGEKWGRYVSEQTENHTRYAMFIDQLMKHGGEIDDAALRKAAEAVRKYHPDGTDMTQFERKYMRLIFPFYSWTRKAIPLMVEGVVHDPKKIVVIPRAQQAIATMMGIDAKSMTEPFPEDQAWPSWIRESGMGPVFAPGMKVPGLPRFGGYGVVTPQLLPPTGVAEMFSGKPTTIAKGILAQTNPIGRMPIEEIRGRQFFGDRPIKDQSQYISQNLPGTAQYTQIAGRDPLDLSQSKLGQPFGAGYYSQKETGSSFNPTKFANWITGLGLKDTGPLAATAPKKEQKLAKAVRRRQKKQPNA